MNIQIRPISVEQTLPIRHHVLWPNQPVEFSRVSDDDRGHHFGAFDGDRLVCVASVFVDDNKARLRKFATLQDEQGRGIGSQMLMHLISQFGRGEFEAVDYFWCDARQSATAFYQRFAMVAFGDPFFKADVPYIKMGRVIPK